MRQEELALQLGVSQSQLSKIEGESSADTRNPLGFGGPVRQKSRLDRYWPRELMRSAQLPGKTPDALPRNKVSAVRDAVETDRGPNTRANFIPGSRPVPDYSPTGLQVLSGSNSVIAVAVSVVVFPRSFCSNTPSWLMMKVITPEFPYSAG